MPRKKTVPESTAAAADDWDIFGTEAEPEEQQEPVKASAHMQEPSRLAKWFTARRESHARRNAMKNINDEMAGYTRIE